jgi:hypothetical protein
MALRVSSEAEIQPGLCVGCTYNGFLLMNAGVADARTFSIPAIL